MRDIIPFISIPTLKVPLTISGIYFAIAEIFQIYIFNDFTVLFFLFLTIGIDQATGIYKAWKLKEVDEKRLEDLAEKCASYFLVLVLVHILTNFTQEPELIHHLRWFRYSAYLVFMAKEALSSARNIEKARPGTIPKWLMTRLVNIESTGIINKDNNDSSDENPPSKDL